MFHIKRIVGSSSEDKNGNLVSAITSGAINTIGLGPIAGALGVYLGSKYGTGTDTITKKLDPSAFNK